MVVGVAVAVVAVVVGVGVGVVGVGVGVGLADVGDGVGDGVGLVVLVGRGLPVVGADVVGCGTTVLGEADGVLVVLVTCDGVRVGEAS